MLITQTNKTINYKNIELFLGKRKGRYFTEGYKNTKFDLTNFVFNENKFHSSVEVYWKSAFGEKRGKEISPHIGTLEYLSISTILSQFLLIGYYGLSYKDIQRSFLRRFKMKTKANRNNSSKKETTTEITNTNILNKRDNIYLSKIKVNIGNVNIFLEIEHPLMQTGIDRQTELAILLARMNKQYYKHGYRFGSYDISNINMNLYEKVINSKININRQDKGLHYEGIGMTHNSIYSMCDFIPIIGQLTQVLLYNLDKLKREETNNMWLRYIDLECDKPIRETRPDANIKFKDHKHLNMNNEQWSVVKLDAKISNMKATISVAHKLNS